jgi:hypothetical protein
MKPKILKTRRERKRETLIKLAILSAKLSLAIEDRKKENSLKDLEIESKKLEIENLKLKKRLMELSIQN